MSTMVGDFTQAGKVGDLKPGEMKMVMVAKKEILLALVGDQYYAADNRCPHMGGNLYQGKLEGSIVTCPRHGSQYDLKDGHVVRWTTWPAALLALDRFRSQRRPLPVYPVKVEDDKIKIKI
jgi:3-phenylpropionate/trans-cinnamate dioxygenase ferredoxin component